MAIVSEVTPSVITAGLNADWKRYYQDYLYSDSWVITFYLLYKDTQITIVGTDNADSFHRFTKLASETASYNAGQYNYTAVAINGTSKVPVETGVLTIKANFITATGGQDQRSPTKIILDNIDKAILELSTKTTSEVTVNGITYKRSSLNDLLKTRSQYVQMYQDEVRALKISQGYDDPYKIYTRLKAR